MREAWPILPGVLAAALGGELLVRGTVGAAGRMRIAPGIVAATVAALGTSSPELAVGIGIAIVAGIVTMLLVIPGRSHRLAPPRGAALLVVYGLYLVALLVAHDR